MSALDNLIFNPERADVVVGTGVNYVNRDKTTTYWLSGPVFPPIPRPELDVAIALLRWALERLEQQVVDEPNRCPECKLLAAHLPLCSRPVKLPWEAR